MNPTFPKTFNLATYFLEHNLDEGRANKPAVLWREEKHTFADTDRRARQAARYFRDLGANIEDRILIALPDRPEFVFALFGILKAGCVLAMANPLVTAEDMAYYLDYTRARVFVCTAEVATKAARAIVESRHLRAAVVVADPGEAHPEGEKFKSWKEVESADADFTTEPTDRDDPAIWLFTSGSTGRPKAAVHFHHDFAYNTECFAKTTVGYRESDVTLSVPKLFFGYATGTNLWFPFAVGATTALFSERATAESVFENVARFKPTLLTSVPTMINAMLAAPEEARRDLSSLRLVFSAGEALPEELYRRWKDTYGVEILDGIGSAELFHIYISNRPGDVRPGSLGKLVPGYEARIARPDGSDAPAGEVGTLWIKGDSAAVYYWQDQEKTKSVFRGGDWVQSGDLFTRDEEGYFYYSGRADDMLKVGGVFVAPLEIEGCLLEHDSVRECCVIGFEDEGLVKPLAVVVARHGIAGDAKLAKALQEHVKKKLTPYKYPRRVVFKSDLPKNDRGKTDRKSLKEALARGEL